MSKVNGAGAKEGRTNGLCCFWNWPCESPLSAHSHVVYITRRCNAQAYKMNAVRAFLLPKIARVNEKTAFSTGFIFEYALAAS